MWNPVNNTIEATDYQGCDEGPCPSKLLIHIMEISVALHPILRLLLYLNYFVLLILTLIFKSMETGVRGEITRNVQAHALVECKIGIEHVLILPLNMED